MENSKNEGCLTSILNALGFTRKPQLTTINIPGDDIGVDSFPYRLRDDFLSQAEASFFHVMKSIVGDRLLIFTKVSLADLFYVARPNENKGARNKIDRKHVDFVICDPNSLKPRFAIELDDSSHKREDRVERDEFVDEVFKAADLPLVHVPAQLTYNTNELSTLIGQTLNQVPQQVPSPLLEKVAVVPIGVGRPEVPTCPKCGVKMVARTAGQGTNAGKKFYGCPNYPKCREIIPIG